MATNIIKWAESVYEKYRDRVARIMGVDPATVVFQVANLGDHPSETSGNVITLDRAHFANLDDPGAIVHEMVHAYFGADAPKTKFHEQIADFVRDTVGLPAPDGSSTETSKFLTWLNQQSPGAVKDLSQAIATRTATDNTFKSIVGVSLDQARTAFTSGTDLPSSSGGPQPGTGPHEGGVVKVGEAGTTTTTGTGTPIPGDTNHDGILSLEEALAAQGNTDTTDKKAERQQNRNQYASFIDQLNQLGIASTPNLEQLAQEAAQKNYSMTTFMSFLRKTPEYADEFKGIFNKDGTMRMTEGQYIATIKAYGDIATKAGIDLSKGDMTWAIRHDVTPTELAARANAVSTLETNKGMFADFQRELVQGGIAKPGEIKQDDLLRFIMGEGNKEWKDLWQDAVTRNTAVQAGITFKQNSDQYVNLKQGILEHISSLGLSKDAMASAFGQIETLLSEALPSSRISGLGLSKKAITKAVVGGRGSALARQRLKRVEGQQKAMDENTLASPSSYTNQQGGFTVAGQAQQRRATE